MKKIILSVALATIQITAIAQTVNVHFKNGQVIEYPSENVDYVDFSAKPSDPSVTQEEAVDLGLSVLWASCNLGATKPEECGGYYAWGETKTKDSYSLENYSYYDSNTTKYTNIGYDISNTEHDAVKVNLGNDWRMPTKEEADELLKNCTIEWTQINSVNGYKLTGSNGNSIFLPASGLMSSSFLVSNNESAHYWTSNNIFETGDYKGSCGLVSTSQIGVYLWVFDTYRYWGLTIRPVKNKTK